MKGIKTRQDLYNDTISAICEKHFNTIDMIYAEMVKQSKYRKFSLVLPIMSDKDSLIEITLFFKHMGYHTTFDIQNDSHISGDIQKFNFRIQWD